MGINDAVHWSAELGGGMSGKPGLDLGAQDARLAGQLLGEGGVGAVPGEGEGQHDGGRGIAAARSPYAPQAGEDVLSALRGGFRRGGVDGRASARAVAPEGEVNQAEQDQADREGDGQGAQPDLERA